MGEEFTHFFMLNSEKDIYNKCVIMNLDFFVEAYLKLGPFGFLMVCFMILFTYIIIKNMKMIEKIYNVLYDENTNNLSLQSAYDMLEAQYNLSKYAIIDATMRIQYENDIANPCRQKIIYDNLQIIAINLQDRDINILSRLKHKNVLLSIYLEQNKNSYEEIVKLIYDNLIAKYKSADLLAVLTNEFNSIINESCKVIVNGK
jgi:hypothetical protein